MDILLQRSGLWAVVSGMDGSPLPIELHSRLSGALSYTHHETTYGADAFDPFSGNRLQFDTYRVPLCSTDTIGRLTTGSGMIPRIFMNLEEWGYTPHFSDITPPSPRGPNVYDAHWDRLASYSFRPLQPDILRLMVDNISGTIVGVPGIGKSFILRTACQLFRNAKIHIVIDGLRIIDGLYRDIASDTPDIGRVDGNHNEQDKRIVLISAKSLHKVNGDCDLLFIDEVHKSVTDHTSANLAETYWRPRVFGFTATAEHRSDQANVRIEYLCGPILIDIPYPLALANGLVCPMEVEWLISNQTPDPVAGVKRLDLKYKRGIWQNEPRNQLFVDAVRQHEDEQVLLLCDRTDQVFHLKRMLPEYTMMYGNLDKQRFDNYKRKGFVGDEERLLTPNEKLDIQYAFSDGTLRKVISTGVWDTGVSFNALSVMGWTSGIGSKVAAVQVPGRLTRWQENKTAKLYDSLDYWNKGFLAKSRERMDMYDSMNWTQILPKREEALLEKRRARRELANGVAR